MSYSNGFMSFCPNTKGWREKSHLPSGLFSAALPQLILGLLKYEPWGVVLFTFIYIFDKIFARNTVKKNTIVIS